MAKKITISLRKGGSGKTTTAVNLATALHKKGKKTLLVDLDPQANATISIMKLADLVIKGGKK